MSASALSGASGELQAKMAGQADRVWSGRQSWDKQLTDWGVTNEIQRRQVSEASLFGKLLTEKMVRRFGSGQRRRPSVQSIRIPARSVVGAWRTEDRPPDSADDPTAGAQGESSGQILAAVQEFASLPSGTAHGDMSGDRRRIRPVLPDEDRLPGLERGLEFAARQKGCIIGGAGTSASAAAQHLSTPRSMVAIWLGRRV